MKYGNSGKYTLGDLIVLYGAKRLIINKEYQRGFVWSKRFQRDLIISLLKGYPINSLILRPFPKDNKIEEIVDGQQRIMTIINFINPKEEKDRLLLNSTHGNIAKEILEVDKKISSFEDLDEFKKIELKSKISIPFQTINGSDEEIKSYFNMIQQQEEIKAGEIISNMPFEIYEDLKEYFNDAKVFLKFMGFNNTRGDFLKILLSNFGIKHKFFLLGSTNDQIIKFAKDINKNFKENSEYKGISKKQFGIDIKNSFIFLNRIENHIDIGKGKVRFLKIFLLITNLIKENSSIDIEFLALINNQLSTLNNKETLIYTEKKEKFIKSLLDLKILNNKDEFKYFVKLSSLFSKTTKINEDNLKTIEFWKNKIVK